MRRRVISVITFFSLVSMLLTVGCTNQGTTSSGSYTSQAVSSAETSSVTTDIGSDPSSEVSSVMSDPLAASSVAGSKPGTSKPSVSSASTSSKNTTVMKDGSLAPLNFKEADPNRWQQTKFYIGAWRAVQWSKSDAVYRKCIQANIEAGINLVQNAVLGRSDMNRAAAICEEEGVEFMVYDHEPTTNGFSCRADLTEQIVQDTVNEYKNYKYLMGYYTWDEVAHNDGQGGPELMPLANQHLKWFEKADPARLAFSIAFPSYGGVYNWSTPAGAAIEETAYYTYIMDYVEQVDPAILGFDYYPIKDATAKLIGSPLWRDLGLLRRVSNETGKPLWWIYQGQDMKDGTPGHLTRANLSAQMFGGIAYGCKSLIYFAGPGLITDEDGNKSTIFNVVKQLNTEVQNIGDLFLDKYTSEIYHFGITDNMEKAFFVDDLSKSKIIKNAPDKTIVSVHGDNKSESRYVMVVNKDMVNSVSGKLELKRGFTVETYDKVNDKHTPMGTNISSIDITIPAGDCVIFKLTY